MSDLTLNARLNIERPNSSNVKAYVQDVNRQLSSATKQAQTFSDTVAMKTQSFTAYAVASAAVIKLSSALARAGREAIALEQEMAKISQVIGISTRATRGLTSDMLDLSVEYGIGAIRIAQTTRTLLQSGLSMDKARKSAELLAKTTLLATFDSIQSTTEGLIAIFSQFDISVEDASKSIDAINVLSKRYAVESADLIDAVKRVGGVFSSTGNAADTASEQLNQLFALITSVRSTTRESIETIATGLRTVFTRIQRPKTIEYFEALGIQLADAEGKFIGNFQAIEAISKGIEKLGIRAGDVKFSAIVEELGGIRQASRVIPLLTQFSKAQEALSLANNATAETDEDVAKAKETLAFRLDQVRAKFAALISEISQSTTFKTLANIVTGLADSFITVASALSPLLPLIAGFAAFKAVDLGLKITSQFTTGGPSGPDRPPSDPDRPPNGSDGPNGPNGPNDSISPDTVNINAQNVNINSPTPPPSPPTMTVDDTFDYNFVVPRISNGVADKLSKLQTFQRQTLQQSFYRELYPPATPSTGGPTGYPSNSTSTSDEVAAAAKMEEIQKTIEDAAVVAVKGVYGSSRIGREYIDKTKLESIANVKSYVEVANKGLEKAGLKLDQIGVKVVNITNKQFDGLRKRYQYENIHSRSKSRSKSGGVLGAFSPQTSTIGVKKKGPTGVGLHEVGHYVDQMLGQLGGGTGFASEQEGTAQNILSQKLMPEIKALLRAGGASEEMVEYRTRNPEIFADFYASMSDEVRHIFTSTADAGEAMEAVTKFLQNGGKLLGDTNTALDGLYDRVLKENFVTPGANVRATYKEDKSDLGLEAIFRKQDAKARSLEEEQNKTSNSLKDSISNIAGSIYDFVNRTKAKEEKRNRLAIEAAERDKNGGPKYGRSITPPSLGPTIEAAYNLREMNKAVSDAADILGDFTEIGAPPEGGMEEFFKDLDKASDEITAIPIKYGTILNKIGPAVAGVSGIIKGFGIGLNDITHQMDLFAGNLIKNQVALDSITSAFSDVGANIGKRLFGGFNKPPNGKGKNVTITKEEREKNKIEKLDLIATWALQAAALIKSFADMRTQIEIERAEIEKGRAIKEGNISGATGSAKRESAARSNQVESNFAGAVFAAIGTAVGAGVAIAIGTPALVPILAKFGAAVGTFASMVSPLVNALLYVADSVIGMVNIFTQGLNEALGTSIPEIPTFKEMRDELRKQTILNAKTAAETNALLKELNAGQSAFKAILESSKKIGGDEGIRQRDSTIQANFLDVLSKLTQVSNTIEATQTKRAKLEADNKSLDPKEEENLQANKELLKEIKSGFEGNLTELVKSLKEKGFSDKETLRGLGASVDDKGSISLNNGLNPLQAFKQAYIKADERSVSTKEGERASLLQEANEATLLFARTLLSASLDIRATPEAFEKISEVLTARSQALISSLDVEKNFANDSRNTPLTANDSRRQQSRILSAGAGVANIKELDASFRTLTASLIKTENSLEGMSTLSDEFESTTIQAVRLRNAQAQLADTTRSVISAKRDELSAIKSVSKEYYSLVGLQTYGTSDQKAEFAEGLNAVEQISRQGGNASNLSDEQLMAAQRFFQSNPNQRLSNGQTVEEVRQQGEVRRLRANGAVGDVEGYVRDQSIPEEVKVAAEIAAMEQGLIDQKLKIEEANALRGAKFGEDINAFGRAVQIFTESVKIPLNKGQVPVLGNNGGVPAQQGGGNGNNGNAPAAQVDHSVAVSPVTYVIQVVGDALEKGGIAAIADFFGRQTEEAEMGVPINPKPMKTKVLDIIKKTGIRSDINKDEGKTFKGKRRIPRGGA